MKMSRILCLIDSLGAGGAERQLAYLAILLREKGHDVKFIVFNDDAAYKFYEDFLIKGGIIPECNAPGKNPIRRIPEIAKYVRKFRPDLTIAYKDGVCMSAVLAKLFGNYNLIVSERASTPRMSLKLRIKLFLFRFANHIVPNSYTQSENIKLFSRRLSPKIKVIVNAVDTNIFYPADSNEGRDYVHILTTARINRVKNILNYLCAIKIVKDAGLKCHFDWYGKTDSGDTYPDEVYAEIKRLDIEDYVSFHPATTDVASVYREADIFCLPSLSEGFPNVICEAMASGLPIVCSNICDNPYIVESGVNGLLFDPDNPEDISSKIIDMINFSGLDKIMMGKANRIKIETLCSPNTYLNNYLSLRL